MNDFHTKIKQKNDSDWNLSDLCKCKSNKNSRIIISDISVLDGTADDSGFLEKFGYQNPNDCQPAEYTIVKTEPMQQ